MNVCFEVGEKNTALKSNSNNILYSKSCKVLSFHFMPLIHPEMILKYRGRSHSDSQISYGLCDLR
jgi:hypothetical protein